MPRGSRAALAVLTLAGVLLAGCGQAEDDGGPGGSGSAPPASTAAQRIVPLNGDVAEIVFALGLGDQVVGTDTSATFPDEAKRKPKIGYQRQLNAEGILSLRPTVAIGTPEAGPPEVLDQLRKAGVKVVIQPVPDDVDGIAERIKLVSDALGVADQGRVLADGVTSEIEQARTKAPAAPTVRVAFLYVRGTKTMMLGGQGTRADLMITAAGAVDAGTQAGVRGFKPLTPEALATARPDAILALDAGLASVGGVPGLLKLPGVAQTPAGQARRIVSLDDQYLLGLGPRAGAALRDLIAKLHAGRP